MMRALAAAALLLVLAACTGEDAPAPAAPTPAFEAPAGIQLADPGAELALGESLTTAYPAADAADGTALTLSVTAVTAAPRRDLALFSVPAGLRPHYVQVTVANRGPAAATFVEPMPWWLHVAGDVLVPPTAMPSSFAPCPPPPADSLAVGETVKGCLLFLTARDQTVESVDFQPGDVATAVRWLP